METSYENHKVFCFYHFYHMIALFHANDLFWFADSNPETAPNERKLRWKKLSKPSRF